MLICIDSCVFIQGFQKTDDAAVHLLDSINPALNLVIPRLIAQEVTRNLTTQEQVRHFYRLFSQRNFCLIVDEPVPSQLVQKYIELGLRTKADAYIGAFCEWMQIHYLVSDNRHFLREVNSQAYQITDAHNLLSVLGF